MHSGVLFLGGLALMFRLAGAAARSSKLPLSRLLGWSLCALAVWAAAGAAGLFSPVGLVLVVAFLFSLSDRAERRAGVWMLGDVTIVAVAAWASIPVPAVIATAILALSVMFAGILIDHSVRRLPPPARAFLVLLPLWVWVGHGHLDPQAREAFVDDKWPQLRYSIGPFFAVVAADIGERIELESGAVAWLTLPPGPPPYRPAVFFHGADEEGSYQRGALFIRRSLVGMGYAVLAVDEPGFAFSPRPQSLEDVAQWDPLPTVRAAARFMNRRDGIEGSILALGHSMGATRAIQLVDDWLAASAGVVLGATVMPPVEDNEQFYDRFLDDYDLETSGLSPEFVLDVRTRYFNNGAAAERLPEGHAPILFLRFAFDYENIIATRDELYAAIPGRKVEWELRTDHQLTSSRIQGALMGDWRVMRALRRGLGDFMDGRNPGNSRPLSFVPRR